MIHPVTEEHVQIVQKALVDYTISGEMLGKGAFGWVFPAEHKETKKQVVVKITTDIASHNQERKYARLMNHPHSVPLEAAGARLRPKMGWLVFSRVETSLYNWCRTWKNNPESAPQSKRERVAATLLVQLLPLLKVLEEKNISHRDLHPGNILVDTKEPWFYIHDYGISTSCMSYQQSRACLTPDYKQQPRDSCVPPTKQRWKSETTSWCAWVCKCWTRIDTTLKPC